MGKPIDSDDVLRAIRAVVRNERKRVGPDGLIRPEPTRMDAIDEMAGVLDMALGLSASESHPEPPLSLGPNTFAAFGCPLSLDNKAFIDSELAKRKAGE